ncbi:exocyst complex component 4 [Patella vulgata]|uniref:exocyst complex component 4 n=1 Tax=Patella vulgata TaxID=6465 RepID=UPI0021803600|nr:exocyst complex component 4 [Patella vulgata]
MANMENKTPTAVKTRETSGFLMSIVRTLSSSADFEQREKEKTRIEKAFRESEKRLGELVTGNHQEVIKVLQAFSSMTKCIQDSRNKMRKIKDDLKSCKTLLHFKRDELKKLWKDGVEHKSVLHMLDQVEQVREIPDKMDSLLANKQYLKATDLIVGAVATLEGPLEGVDALRDLKLELISRKEKLHEVLIKELNHQVYEKSFELYINSRRRNISRTSPGNPISNPVGQEITDSLQVRDREISVDGKPADNIPIGVLIESLSILRRLPDAIETIKAEMEPELMNLVSKVSQQIVEHACQQGEPFTYQNQSSCLLEFLETIFAQFRCVAKLHQSILSHINRITSRGMPIRSVLMYDMKDVWSKIQAVLQVLLGEYLDVQNTISINQQSTSAFDEPSADIKHYFSKKRTTRPKKLSLFRFDASLHALSTNSYIEDNRHFDTSEYMREPGLIAGMAKHQFVCKPAANNITAIYKPLKVFIKEIETAMECPAGLQEFVNEFLQKAFLGQVYQRVSKSIDEATRGFDALRHVIDEKSRRDLGVPRPLLQSTVTVERNIQELRELMQDLPDCSEQFLNMICNVLGEYKDKCHAAYRDIVQHGSDEKRVISAMWAKDEDISRFLRSLPGWRTLQPGEGQELDRTVCSEEEMRALNSKESIILITNLSSDDNLIPQQEIITDITQMRTVANVHESLEWFAFGLRQFVSTLTNKSNQTPSDIPKVSEKILQSLSKLVQDFQDLAEICLLLLHLEVRVHCFYYLLPVAKQSNYAGPIDDLDPDSNVLKLNKDLTSMEEVLAQSLQPKKFKYIFESLGYLVASILINSIQYLKKINENGIKKMCRNILAIQQNLTNITLTREADLDRARHFYEQLYLQPDDILTLVAEKGTNFTHTEYSQLIQLYHRSHPNKKSYQAQDKHLQRLTEVWEKGQHENRD